MSASTKPLYAAARAAGYQVARVSDGGDSLLLVGVQEPWNPLADDGDALRLAVKLRMNIRVQDYGASARIEGHPHGAWNGCESHMHGGIESATRRAIVQAAAAIGRALQPNHESPANSKPGCIGGGG